jgi:hypothetical protein
MLNAQFVRRAGPATRLLVILIFPLAVACGGDDDIVYRFEMQGVPMVPTIPEGTDIQVTRYDATVEAGDIIVFRSPVSIDRIFAKRVIAVRGLRSPLKPVTCSWMGAHSRNRTSRGRLHAGSHAHLTCHPSPTKR